MKKATLGLIIIAVLVVLFGAMPTAFAADGIDVDASVYPKQVLGPGKVTLSVTIVATGTENLEAVELYKNGKLLESYGTITAGEYKKYYEQVNITQAEIGDGKVKVQVKYSYAGESKTVNKNLSVQLKPPTVNLEKSFWVDREIIPEGRQIGLRFKFANTGGVTVTGLRVRDSNIASGAWLNNGITIAPGETRIITYNLTLSRDTEISPEAKYTANGKEYTIYFDSKSLRVVQEDVSMELTASTTNPAAGEEVEFTLRMRNGGNVFLQKIKLYNHNNEIIKLPGSQLRYGEAFAVTTTAVFRESADVQFDIIAEDSYGSVYSYASNAINISVPINFIDSDLTITAEPEFTNLAKPGDATFDILLNNASEYSLYDIAVIDESTGETVTSITNMERGERLLRIKTPVNESRDVVFRVEAHDANGDVHMATTADAPTSINVLSQAAAEAAEAEAAATVATPTPSPAPEQTGVLGKTSVWMLVLIILGVLTLGVIIAISALVAAEKRKQGGGGNMPSGPTPKAPTPPPSSKQNLKGSSVPTVPKKRPGGPKKKNKRKKRSGPIRVSYRDKNNF